MLSIVFCRLTGLIIQTQHIAIPMSLITVNSDENPVLKFYVQLNSTTYVTPSTVAMAQCRSILSLYFCLSYMYIITVSNRELKIFIEMLFFFHKVYNVALFKSAYS